MTCSYEVSAHSAAPPARVFALLADATSWPRWAGFFIASGSWERTGDPAPGGVGAVRKVGRWPVFGYEEIVAYQPDALLTYTIVRGQPVRNYRADVRLAPDGRGGTAIRWSATFEVTIPGTAGLMTAFFRRLVGSFARRLAAYAET